MLSITSRHGVLCLATKALHMTGGLVQVTVAHTA
jgi:hypothetical protein